MNDKTILTGRLVFEHFRQGKLIDREEFHNGITTAGKNSLLDVYFRAQTQITAWYLGLIDNAGFSALSAADTMSSHAGWTESTAYSDSTRQQWVQSAASSGSITNGTAATFNINGTATLYGTFVTSVSTKGGTTGTLWSTAAFSSTKAVINGDQVKLTYTVNA